MGNIVNKCRLALMTCDKTFNPSYTGTVAVYNSVMYRLQRSWIELQLERCPQFRLTCIYMYNVTMDYTGFKRYDPTINQLIACQSAVTACNWMPLTNHSLIQYCH